MSFPSPAILPSPGGSILIVDNIQGKMRVAQSLSSWGQPQSAVFHPSGEKAYVGNRGRTLEVLSRRPNGSWFIASRIGIPNNGSGTWFGVDVIAMARDGSRVLVHSNVTATSGGVFVIDTATDTIIARIPTPNDTISGGIASIGL